MAEEDKNYVEAPKSRLDANTLAKSRAFDAQRRAVNAQRQQMGVERTMQRQFRRAVRKGDLNAISVYGNQLDKLGVSKTGGGGIQSAEENDFQAARRAELSQQAGNKMGENFSRMTNAGNQRNNQIDNQQENSDAIEAETRTANPNATAGAGRGTSIQGRGDKGSDSVSSNRGDQVVDASKEGADSVAGGATRDQSKIFGSKFEGPRARFIKDLQESKLIKDSSKPFEQMGAIDRAVERGSKFGITREQIESFSEGFEDNSKSAIAQRKQNAENKANQDIIAQRESAEKKEVDALVAQASKAKDVFSALDRKFDPSKSLQNSSQALNWMVRNDEKSDGKRKISSYSDILERNKEVDQRAQEKIAQNQRSLEQRNVRNAEESRNKAEEDYWFPALETQKYLAQGTNVETKSYGGTLPPSMVVTKNNDPRVPAFQLKAKAERMTNQTNMMNPDFQATLARLAVQENVDISGFAKFTPGLSEKYDSAKKDLQQVREDNDLADQFRADRLSFSSND